MLFSEEPILELEPAENTASYTPEDTNPFPSESAPSAPVTSANFAAAPAPEPDPDPSAGVSQPCPPPRPTPSSPRPSHSPAARPSVAHRLAQGTPANLPHITQSSRTGKASADFTTKRHSRSQGGYQGSTGFHL